MLSRALSPFAPPKESVRGGALSEQLKLWLADRKREQAVPKEDAGVQQTDRWHNIATQLPQLVILFSSLDEAISLNS